VSIRQAARNAVVRFAGGQLGYVVAQRPSKHQTYVYVAGQGALIVSEDTRVQVVVTPDDLAYAYVERPAMRTLVQHALAQARLQLAQSMDNLLSPKPQR
jgi:hypothetical protein